MRTGETFYGVNCDRCGEGVVGTTMSMFNTEMICEKCERKEKAHPKYDEARQAEIEQIRKGDYNFPGIGKPKDL